MSRDGPTATAWHQDSRVLLSALLSAVVLGQMASPLGNSVSMAVKREG